MAGTQKAAVIVPFYRDSLSAWEKVALDQCFKMLGNHPIIAIKPRSLKLTVTAGYAFTEMIDFDDHFFAGIAGYNALMLSEVFYGRFLHYEYVLLYQLDAFVFKDELEYWCNLGYDYIGAPWIRAKEYPHALKRYGSILLQKIHRRYNIKKRGMTSKKQLDDNVGNGGFSLRRTQKFYDCCLQYRQKIAEYNAKPSHHYNEDIFWGIELNRKQKVMNIPGYIEALKFAFELVPDRALRLNQNQLPFGCHAWDKFPDFWRPIFEQHGQKI